MMEKKEHTIFSQYCWNELSALQITLTDVTDTCSSYLLYTACDESKFWRHQVIEIHLKNFSV